MDHNTHTHVWQEERGKPVFRFQTQDKDVHLYLSRKEGFKLVGWGFNIDLWIYRAKYQSLSEAQETLQLAVKAVRR